MYSLCPISHSNNTSICLPISGRRCRCDDWDYELPSSSGARICGDSANKCDAADRLRFHQFAASAQLSAAPGCDREYSRWHSFGRRLFRLSDRCARGQLSGLCNLLCNRFLSNRHFVLSGFAQQTLLPLWCRILINYA